MTFSGRETGRWPWGSGPAPPHNCHECGRRIGERRFHCMINNSHVLCGKCIAKRHLHVTYYPDCSDRWHDMYDHGVHFASRAAAWYVLTKPGKASQ